MFVGIPNPNILIPVEKMQITDLTNGETFQVLYNPQTYVRQKTAKYQQINPLGADAPFVQFHHGEAEHLMFELFFDSVSAGAEVGGSFDERKKFGLNSLTPTIAGQIDVRDYTRQITNLMYVDSNEHRPPLLKVEWASLQFKGFLISCTERFVRFNEHGQPVRAYLKCVFMEFRDYKEMFIANPLNSPDTTKYHTVSQGDSLWALAAQEYGDAGKWRVIAEANGLSNPRVLRNGEMLVVPALV